MPFVFDKSDWTVRDAQRGIVMQSRWTTFGENGERGGGSIAHLNWPQQWGDSQVSARVFLKVSYPTPNSVHLHYKLNIIHIPDPIRDKEKEIVALLEETFKYFPETYERVDKITTDFSGDVYFPHEVTRI